MRCEECLEALEDYNDGELDDNASRAVADHTRGCPECASLAVAFSREQEIYALYERDVDVTPALWAAIESRIEQERALQESKPLAWLRRTLAVAFRTPQLSPAFAAALVVLTVGLTVAVMSYLQARDNPAPIIAEVNKNSASNENGPQAGSDPVLKDPVKKPGPVPAVQPDQTPGPSIVSGPATPGQRRVERAVNKPIAPRAKDDPERLVREAESKYMAAIGILMKDFSRRRSQLSPDAAARFDTAIANIDDTIFATRRAVRENPGDPVALGYLLSAYSKKVEFLREMARD